MRIYEKTIEVPELPYKPPKTGNGDADFDGHGPRVSASVEINIRNGTELWVHSAMSARETKSDYTEASGTDDFRLFTVDDPRYQTIEDIVSDAKTEYEYVDTDHDDDVFSIGAGELVNEFTFVGDRKGKDAGNETGMKVRFNPVTIRIRDTRPAVQ